MVEHTVTVGGAEVPLTYYDMDASVLKNVKKFGPFAEWLQKTKPSKEFSIEKIHIQNIDWVGKRVEGITVQVNLKSNTGQESQQNYFSFSYDTTPTTVVLPVLTRVDTEYVLLSKKMPLPLLDTQFVSAMSGQIQSGELQCRNKDFLMDKGVNIRASDLVPLSERTFHSSVDGSSETVKFAFCQLPTFLYDKFPMIAADAEQFLLCPIADLLQKPFADARTVLALQLYGQRSSS
eukprot:TRINITY_DN51415_c0_g1_i1.p1 TRINITY_DN51415_c0_g1~~TRINITY_DN51415_c0_g1_i1.p1  ORF type:complete len:234 (-),score=12.31 TRINITY_DN51415_c0_g1_i1:769-1470(-)